MLADAFLAVTAAIERAQRPPSTRDDRAFL
jgi:hypothetical protein